MVVLPPAIPNTSTKQETDKPPSRNTVRILSLFFNIILATSEGGYFGNSFLNIEYPTQIQFFTT